MMKRLLTIMVACFVLPFAALAGTVERTYVTTDRSCYVAGDRVWLSAFCVDVTDGFRMSGFSSIAYVELCSEEGVEATAKLALTGGRGAGSMILPRSLPTGNYKIIAYTAQNRNEDGYDFFCSSRTISVFNTFTTERRPGVKIVSDEEYASHAPARVEDTGKVGVSLASRDGRKVSIDLSGRAGGRSSFSVSVYHEDGINSPEDGGIGNFMKTLSSVGGSTFSPNVIPDYEGEVITGHCVGADAASFVGEKAVISSPGDLSSIYFSEVEEDGTVRFFTGNIYGDNVLVCQLAENTEKDAHIELDSPFVPNRSEDDGTLYLCGALRDRLSQRSVSMQIGRMFDADTLFDMLPKRPNLTFSATEPSTYILKDYTRFPVMNEVFVEFVKGVGFRTSDGRHYVRTTMLDASKTGYQSSDGTLVLVDGTPVFDHERIYAYDPLLVQRLDIYYSTFFFGPYSCNGVVNLVTYRKDMPGLTFPESVRVVDFQGAGVPRALTCRGISENGDYPDYRKTVYWHPQISLEAGESQTIECQLPSYDGSFRLVVEGITEDGEAVHETLLF